MADNLESALSELSRMLATNEGKDSLKSMLGAFGLGGASTGGDPPVQEVQPAPSRDFPDNTGGNGFNPFVENFSDIISNRGNHNNNSGFGGGGASQPIDPTAMAQIAGMLNAFQDTSGPQHQLLGALRPYLSTKRQGRFDAALRVMQLTRLPGIARDFRKR